MYNRIYSRTTFGMGDVARAASIATLSSSKQKTATPPATKSRTESNMVDPLKGAQASTVRNTDMPYAPKHKNRRVAALLSIFFGLFGVHKFYMGNWKAGIAQFAISFTAISASGMARVYLPFSAVAIFACAEGIVYALKSDEAFDAEEINGGRWFL